MSNLLNTEAGDERRASPVGAYIAMAGAVVLLVSVWLDWLTLGSGDSEADTVSGYEADGVIPLMAYLALGFALAMIYATGRAYRRQHRGLSLASFAVGLASLLWVLSFIIDPISTIQYNENVSTEVGPWVALLGALLWTVGSFLLAKEPEGDLEQTAHTVARPVTTHTETHRVDTGASYDTDVDHTARTTHTGSHSVGGVTEGDTYSTRRPGTQI
jgi:hypothetical protein